MAKVAIIGAGMAGLACAIRLRQLGVKTVVFEASDSPGGRVRTDDFGLYRLDRGFQVFLSGYKETGKLLGKDAPALYPFSPGAMLRVGDRWYRVPDPFRVESWEDLLDAWRAPVGTLGDKIRVALLRHSLASTEPVYDTAYGETSALDWIRARGFSERIIQRFFRPFYGGIFLEKELATSAAMFRFTFGHFARGFAALPAGGMGQIPARLASRAGAISYRNPVARLEGTTLIHTNGSSTQADAVVVATEGPVAARLTGQPEPKGHAVTCLYFSSDSPPWTEAMVGLNAGPGPIHNLVPLDRVGPGYAPRDRSLLSVTVLGEHDPESLRPAVESQLANWFPKQRFDWLRGYRIPYALPMIDSKARGVSTPRERVLLAGDYLQHASIEGAVISGNLAAAAVSGI
ncbi:MAG: FAD-dependent oxidoreductase [Verrucomicrobiales bacterium]